MTRKSLLILAPFALLAACGDNEPVAETTSDEGGEATGEVLGGTISDEMIPLDQLTSTSPPAEPSASEAGGGSDAASAPASSPEPEAEPESEEAEPAAADPAPEVAAPLEE